MNKLILSIFYFTLFNNYCFSSETANEAFFANEAKLKELKYTFNPFETALSGTFAVIIGNVGFYTTKSSILKIGYSSIQTIGVINVSKGIYNVNSPNMEEELSHLLATTKNNTISKEILSQKLIEIYAKEDRAKRIALFYGASLISSQYFLNAFIGNTQKELKNIYLFMGGINLLIAGYSLNSKSSYEKKYFGESFDLKLVALTKEYDTTIYQKPDILPGLLFTYKY